MNQQPHKSFLSAILAIFGPSSTVPPERPDVLPWLGQHRASEARAYRRSQVAFHGRRQAIKLIKANRRAAKLAGAL